MAKKKKSAQVIRMPQIAVDPTRSKIRDPEFGKNNILSLHNVFATSKYAKEEKPPELNTWREFYGLSNRIYALKPWKHLKETDYFGIRLPGSGRNYFVSIVGNNSNMCGLSFYKEDLSFMDFWEMRKQNIETPPESIFLIDQIVVSWHDQGVVEPDQQEILDALEINYISSSMCPDILHSKPGYLPNTPGNTLLQDVNILLAQSLDLLTREIETGTVINKDKKDSCNFLFRVPEKKDGICLWKDEILHFNEDEGISYDLEVEESIVQEFNSLPKKWDHLEVGLNIIPTPMPVSKTEAYFPFVLLISNPEDDSVTGMKMVRPVPDFQALIDNLPTEILQQFIKLGSGVSSLSFQGRSMLPITTFLNKQTKVKANIVTQLPTQKKAMEGLFSAISDELTET